MNWKRVRKRPIIVRAVQWNPDEVSVEDFEGHLSTKENESTGVLGTSGNDLVILTLEGAMVAHPGDWVIRGVENELYPVREDIFRLTYEEVE